ncbi:phage gp6-like head-tail connector protein [Streptomyces sp. NPDC059982]|uniref:phage gp6-like head-tail connector protein n=1 Tax=unclassified Streptomyces TaxID=2593676 RepID=UPI00367E1A88
MSDLATPEDVATRINRPLTDDDTARVAAFIADVSALVRDHCSTDFALHRDDLVHLDVNAGQELRLPRFMKPLISIAEIRWADGTVIDDWVFAKGSLWRPGGWIPPPGGRFLGITVKATYGYVAVPDTVRAVTSAEVIRWLAVQPGITAERVGELEVSYGTTPTQGLSAAAERALRRFRPRHTSRHIEGASAAL